MRLVVTGGAGYIGSHIVCELNARTEHEVVVVDTMEKGSEVNLFPKNEFIQGDIDNMPIEDNIADVIVSNCVLNLVPDKDTVFREMFRVTKPGGHFSISDIVLAGELPEALKKDAMMYAGCVSGAIQKDEYINLIRKNGFENITVQKEKAIVLPDNLLRNYLNDEELARFKDGASGIFSITVYAEKPSH